MKDKTYYGNTREFTQLVDKNFPLDHFGVGDKLTLSRVVREEVERIKKRNAMLIISVLTRMKEEYGFSPIIKLEEYI